MLGDVGGGPVVMMKNIVGLDIYGASFHVVRQFVTRVNQVEG